MTVNLTIGSTNALGAIEIASMDIETALMAVQTRRADLLESQLRGQLEAVQDRNMQIESINSILAAVRAIRPTGDADSTRDTGDSTAEIQVPADVVNGQGGSEAELARLQAELNALLDLKENGGSTGTGGSGGGGGSTTTLTVPSAQKIEDNSNPNTAEYVDALNALVDLNAPLADESEFASFVGGNSGLTSKFVAWVASNQGVVQEMYGENFSIGFSADADQNDIGRALANNPEARELFETFLRLSVQGNGTAAPPNTDIIVAADPDSTKVDDTDTTTEGTGTVPDDIDAQIEAKREQILALQSAPGTTTSTTVSMTLNGALAAYGFTPTGKLTQAQFDQLIPTITSRIDSLNSSQQLDMLRLQNLTNKRNEAFDVMTNFIKKLQDNRSSIVGNLR